MNYKFPELPTPSNLPEGRLMYSPPIVGEGQGVGSDSKNRFADYLIFRCVLLAGINAGPWSEGERKRLVNIFVVCFEAS